MTTDNRPLPLVLNDAEQACDVILERLGKTIVFGMPLGLGKPAELANALFRRAMQDASIHLKILTALSLEVPKPTQPLEKALLDPLLKRVFDGVPELAYMPVLRQGKLPANIEICEFFFKPGSLLHDAHAQQHYISSNYTHAARDVFNQGCNVAAQLVCKRDTARGTHYSLSANPDTGPELVEMLRASGRPHLAIAEVNQNLPFMGHDAEVPANEFDLVLDHPRYSTPLFSTPKTPVGITDYAIGLTASALLKDGGTLQVGIGALGDAVAQGAILRQRDNATWQQALAATGVGTRHAELIADIGGTAPFTTGLYGATEMLVDAFMPLYEAGILKRRVYDFWALQQLVNEGRIDSTHIDVGLLEKLAEVGVPFLRPKDFAALQYHGVFRDDCRYEAGHIINANGDRLLANLASADSRAALAGCLGTALRNGIIAHGGFFLGPQAFYSWLKNMPDAQRADFCMTGVNKVNQLDLNPRLYKLQRRHARFVNTGIMATLTGAVVSDALENGQVISGVGGQYNFVSMAHQLVDGRSILMVKSVREKGSSSTSNIVASYGHCTIPRHLRDLVITEYGVAELRSQNDSEIIKRLLCITDSRFQPALLAAAKQSGKLEASWNLPEWARQNTPARLATALQPFQDRALPAFPFGTDLDATEILLADALQTVKTRAATTPKWKLLASLLNQPTITPLQRPYLERLSLLAPKGLENKVAQRLLLGVLSEKGVH